MYDRLREDPRRGPPASTAIWKSCGWNSNPSTQWSSNIFRPRNWRGVSTEVPASISRDLSGGLSTAKNFGRVREMADAVGYDVVALLVPRDPVERVRRQSDASLRSWLDKPIALRVGHETGWARRLCECRGLTLLSPARAPWPTDVGPPALILDRKELQQRV